MGEFSVSAFFRNRLIVFSFFLLGYALKCNECVSLKSWDDCKNKTKVVTCLDSQDRCGKADIKAESSGVTGEVFVKGCATSSECSEKNCKKFSPSGKITKCEVECCKGDLCNGAQLSINGQRYHAVGMRYRRFCSLKFEIKSLNVALCRKRSKMNMF